MSGERGGMTRQKESPYISVVIPCFNLGGYLDEAVGSVLGQTLGDLEIIVVDPGSTDEATRAILAGYRRPKTEVLSTGSKRAGAARNAGIARARGRYICCLDADDILEPACLEKAAAAMDRDPGVGIVTYWFDVFGETTGRVAPESASLADFLVDNCACTASLFRREAWEKVGGYDEELEGYEDWDFWLGILEQGYRAEIVKESLFRYRDRAGGKHRASDRGERRDAIMRRIIRRHEGIFRTHATEVIFGKDKLLGEYRTYREDAVGEARRLKGSYDEAVRRVGELERTQRELGDEMRRQTAELRRALDGREHDLRAVYASKAWRIGCLIQESWRSLRRLPYGLTVRLLPARAKDAVPLSWANAVRRALGAGREELLFRQKRREGPLVSVVIPCYNYGRYLDEALSSALSQTLENREIIVIDDGSTDPLTVGKIAELEARRLPGVTVIRQENRGVCRARNNAIRAARGKYICCLDADDVLDPTYLEKCAAAMESGGLDISYSWVRIFGDDTGVWGTEPFDAGTLLIANRVPVSAVFTREIWEKTGGYNPNMERGNEDWDFWISIAGAGGCGRVIPEALFRYRRHGAGRDAEALKRMDELVERIRLNHPDLYAGKIPRPRPCLVALNPFVNLAPASPFARTNRKGVLIACGTIGSDAARCAEEHVRAGREVHVVALDHPREGAEAPDLSAVTPYVFTLPAFLEARFRTPFVLDYIARRGIGEVRIMAGGEALSTAIRKRYPGLTMGGVR